MSIGIVGRRRMLLDAIAALRTGADAKAPTPSSTAVPPAPVAAASTPEGAGAAAQRFGHFVASAQSTSLSMCAPWTSYALIIALRLNVGWVGRRGVRASQSSYSI